MQFAQPGAGWLPDATHYAVAAMLATRTFNSSVALIAT